MSMNRNTYNASANRICTRVIGQGIICKTIIDTEGIVRGLIFDKEVIATKSYPHEKSSYRFAKYERKICWKCSGKNKVYS